MGDLTIGSALVINDKTLAKIQEIDNKIKNIQTTADATAKGVSKSFSDMANGVNPFITALDNVIAKLNTIQTSVSNAGSGLNNIASGTSNIGTGASQATQGIIDLVNRLSQVGGKGSSSIMQAVLAFQRLQESTKGASGMNIAQLKEEISAINKMLNDVSYNLTKVDQDGLIKRKKTLQDELKYQQQMCEERVVAFQKALDRMSSAEQSYNNKQKKLYNDRAKDYQKQNYKSNTTYQGALDFSATANTLNRQVRAIEYLKEARMKLSTTDVDYKRKLETLNAAISEHNKKLKEAGINTRQLGEKTSYLAGYLTRLAQRTAVVFSLGAAKNFVEQIAEVRGQFELSQRSLEAILQNKPKADEIFNKTVELAVKSPFRIKDLVDYTRQLSAYRIESNKLYDTTKRLADVSAGLGVDMGRLILAYGQVKAAAYLRGSEVRQFTEAGVNMYGELQEYFKEVKGEAYTTAQIVDMISKRKVTFEDVEAIFQRMTDKGGTFYNMQEIQAETLQGKISNLKDAFDVMLNDIGKDNEGTFKGLISGATVLLNNWDKIAAVGEDLVGVLALIMLQANKTGVSLKGMWMNTGFTTYSVKGKNTLGILANSFKTLGSAAKSAGIIMKDALVSNLPLLAFTSLIQLVWNATSAYISFREEQKKITTETIDAKKKLGELSAEYERIKDKYAGKKDSTGNRIVTDWAKFKEESKSILDSLSDELKARKLEVPIEIKEPDPATIDKAIQASKKKLDSFIQMAQDAKSYINKEDNSFWNSNNLNLFGIPLWADSFSKDMKELDDAANDVREFSSRAQTAIDALGEGYDKLSIKSKAAYDSIKDGAKPGELDVEYLQRVNETLKQIFANEQNNDSFKKYADNLRKRLYDMYDANNNLGAVISGSFKNAKEEAAHELQGLFDYTNNVWGGFLKSLKPAEVKVFWDNVAVQNNLNELQKKILMIIASKVYHFKVDSDQQSMDDAKQRIYTFIDDLQAEADRRKIKISLGVVNPKDALDTVKGFQSSAKDIKKLIDQINRGQIQWFHGSSLGIGSTMKWGKQNVGTNTVFKKSDAIAFLQDQLKDILAKNTLAGGADPFAKENSKAARENAKNQRDILQERISLLKDMNAKYDELIKTETKETALSKTRNYFKEAAQNVGWKVEDILPSDKDVVKKIRELANTTKDIGKKGNYLRMAADIELKVSQKEYDKFKEDVSRNIENLFSELSLYKKLKGEGLSDGIIQNIFGDITTSFDDLQKRIDDEFNKYITRAYEKDHGKDYSKWGQKVIDAYNNELEHTSTYIHKYGDDVSKAYNDRMQEVNKKIKQDSIDTFSELTKAYKTQLSDQLQLDKWYIEEKNKLETNKDLAKDPELKKQYSENLDKMYRKRSDENTWKDFQNSDMYVRLFDNLEQVSNKALDAMAERLQQLRDNLKDLSPTELKAVVDQLNQVNEVRNSRNPFKAFTSGLKEMATASKELKKLGGVEKYVELNTQQADTKKQLEIWNKQVEALQQQYDQQKKVYGVENGITKKTQLHLTISKSIRDELKKQLGLTDEQIAKLGNVMTDEEKAKAKFSKSVTDITSIVSTMATAFSGLFEALGGSDAKLENTLNIVDNIGQAVGSFYKKDWAGMAAGAMGAITGVVKLFTDESDIDAEIERQERAVSALQHAYQKLKKSLDDAFDIQRLQEYNSKSVEALKDQKKAYVAMIKAEEGRKNPDDAKIQQWRQQIEDIDDTIKELGESLTESLGGFGSQANYKSAAEAFADAWVEAFNEGSDALEALDEKFDEYIKNMVKKQIVARAAERFIQPVLDAFDKAVEEGSEGGNNGLEVTSREIEKIKSLWATNKEGFNEYAKSLMDILGITSKGSSTLSNLQQGIQSVTESTAQALESILNSMRFYLAQQQSDVRAIRDILIERLGRSVASIAQGSSDSPVLIELRVQTAILTDIRDTLSSCVKSGHSQGSKGIKVFMN